MGRYASAVVIVSTLLSPPVATQAAFHFQNGQRVYVTAFHAEHAASGSSQVVRVPGVVESHLPAELQIRKDFAKFNRYTLVDKASDADIVFLVVVDDSAAEGLAVLPSTPLFTQYRNVLDFEALRAAAYGRWTVGPLKIHSLGRLSSRLVDAFHAAPRATTRVP